MEDLPLFVFPPIPRETPLFTLWSFFPTTPPFIHLLLFLTASFFFEGHLSVRRQPYLVSLLLGVTPRLLGRGAAIFFRELFQKLFGWKEILVFFPPAGDFLSCRFPSL